MDTFQPKREKREFTQKSTCLASLSLARQRKSSKNADHINFKRDDPIFQMAKETLRKAVTDAIEPKGRTLCLKIFAPLDEGSPRARKLSTPKRGYVASAAKDQVTIGIHFSPEEFVHEALSLRHPTEQQSLFPKEVKENVTHLSTCTVHQIAIERTEQIRRRTAFAIDTDKEEKASKSALSHRIADVLKDKRLRLLDKLIKESGHEDHTLVDDLTKGFDLTGQHKALLYRGSRPRSVSWIH